MTYMDFLQTIHAGRAIVVTRAASAREFIRYSYAPDGVLAQVKWPDNPTEEVITPDAAYESILFWLDGRAFEVSEVAA